MEQFNKDLYKKETLFQQFYHSCFGKLVILAAILLVLFLVAVFSVPSSARMLAEADDNVQECLQDHDTGKTDDIDEVVNNIGRSFVSADTSFTNKESYRTYLKHNKLDVFKHFGYSTVRLFNNRNPQGVRIALGIFGCVFSTVRYSDLLMDTGAINVEYDKKLIDPQLPEDEEYENPLVEPYHYLGNPED